MSNDADGRGQPRPHSAWTDERLIRAVTVGELSALGEIHRRHSSSMVHLARQLLGDRSIAEDIVQEVFIKFWERGWRYDGDRGSLRSFLLMQTRGRSIDLLRAEGSRRRREKRTVDRDPVTRAGWTDPTVRHAEAELIREALRRLPDRERLVIELAYFEGLTYREVADYLTEPEGTIKGRARGALRDLRRILDPGDSIQD